MKKISILTKITVFVVSVFVLSAPLTASAATTPSLASAASYGILSSTYTNTTPGTTVNGDVGFTTPPVVVPAGVHTFYGSGAPYAVAGTNQASALADINSQACTFTFAPGAINLSTDATHGTIGVYTPGVYCTSGPGAASIGTAGITLSGTGTFIFKINGALTSVANSAITLQGASACDVLWAPTQATTLGANSTFAGTNIDASGITLGSMVTWVGRALAFGGTVTTDTDTISVPSCTAPSVISGGAGSAGVITGGCLWTGPNACSSYGITQPGTTPLTTTTTIVSPTIIVPPVKIAAIKLPNTGLAPREQTSQSVTLLLAAISLISLIILLAGKKQTR